MTVIDAIKRLALAKLGSSEQSALPRLKIMVPEQPTELVHVLYRPTVCLKRVRVAEKVLDYHEGQFAVATAEVAAFGQILDASPDRPYIAVTLALDAGIIAPLLSEAPAVEPTASLRLESHDADSYLLDAWRRFVDLLNQPAQMHALAPIVEREIIVRLLLGPSGPLLREMAGTNTKLVGVRKAMTWLRVNYNRQIVVEELAEIAGMSASSFHKHFKEITAISPIHYQKQVRLHEARSRPLKSPTDAAGVAFAIG